MVGVAVEIDYLIRDVVWQVTVDAPRGRAQFLVEDLEHLKTNPDLLAAYARRADYRCGGGPVAIARAIMAELNRPPAEDDDAG